MEAVAANLRVGQLLAHTQRKGCAYSDIRVCALPPQNAMRLKALAKLLRLEQSGEVAAPVCHWHRDLRGFAARRAAHPRDLRSQSSLWQKEIETATGMSHAIADRLVRHAATRVGQPLSFENHFKFDGPLDGVPGGPKAPGGRKKIFHMQVIHGCTPRSINSPARVAPVARLARRLPQLQSVTAAAA